MNCRTCLGLLPKCYCVAPFGDGSEVPLKRLSARDWLDEAKSDQVDALSYAYKAQRVQFNQHTAAIEYLDTEEASETTEALIAEVKAEHPHLASDSTEFHARLGQKFHARMTALEKELRHTVELLKQAHEKLARQAGADLSEVLDREYLLQQDYKRALSKLDALAYENKDLHSELHKLKHWGAGMERNGYRDRAEVLHLREQVQALTKALADREMLRPTHVTVQAPPGGWSEHEMRAGVGISISRLPHVSLPPPHEGYKWTVDGPRDSFTASGEELDRLGATHFGLARNGDEPDAEFRARMRGVLTEGGERAKARILERFSKHTHPCATHDAPPPGSPITASPKRGETGTTAIAKVPAAKPRGAQVFMRGDWLEDWEG